PRTFRPSTSSRTCASATASARGSARSARTRAPARWRSRFMLDCRRRTPSGSSRRYGRPSSMAELRMVFLGFGKYVRADKIYALAPLAEGERGHGARTRVWVEGIPDPIIASRTERAILGAMGGGPEAPRPSRPNQSELF